VPASASLSIAAVVDQVGGVELPDPVVLAPGLRDVLRRGRSAQAPRCPSWPGRRAGRGGVRGRGRSTFVRRGGRVQIENGLHWRHEHRQGTAISRPRHAPTTPPTQDHLTLPIRVSRTSKGVRCGRCGFVVDDAVREMKELALRSRPAGGGFKPPRAALAEDRRGERSRKRHPMRCQVGIRKTSASESLLTCRNKDRWHQNRGVGSCAPG